MHIGLIGGIGVAATVVYYQRLTAAFSARGRPLALTISHADAATLVRNNREDNRTAQAEIFVQNVDALKGAGADCAALTSLGAHFCYNELEARSALPLISGVAPLDEAFVGQGIGRVGLLGSPVVMRTLLYGQLTQTEAVAPGDDFDLIGQTYMDMAVAGRCTPQQRALFVDAGRRMIDDRGADAVVLAGTDLNLAFDGTEPGYQVIDALDIHVERLARLASADA